MHIRFLSGVCGALLLCGCALPVAEQPMVNASAGSVPSEELEVVELARDGKRYFDQSRFADAEDSLRAALALAARLYPPGKDVPQQLVPLMMGLAATLERQERYEESRQIYDQIVTSYPAAFDPRFQRGKLELSAKRYDEAFKLMQEAYELALAENLPEKAWIAAKSISSMRFNLGDQETALCYSRLALKHSNALSEHLRHARLLLASGRLSEADLFVNQLTVERELQNDSAVLFERALIAYALGRDDDARALLRIAALPQATEQGLRDEAILLERILLPQAGAADDSEENEEQLERLAALLRVLGTTQGSMALFWPVRLLDDAAQLSAELNIDDPN